MSDNLPDLKITLEYCSFPLKLEPFKLTIIEKGEIVQQEFYYNESDSIEQFYCILRLIPEKLRQFLSFKLSTGSSRPSTKDISLLSLISRLESIPLPLKPEPLSTQIYPYDFYVNEKFESEQGVTVLLKDNVHMVKHKLMDFVSRQYYFVCHRDIHEYCKSAIQHFGKLAKNCYIYLRFFRDLKRYHEVRIDSSWNDLEKEQLESIKTEFRDKFEIFEYSPIPVYLGD